MNASKITRSLPDRPAAVMVHGVDGRVATLCLDFDTSKALKGVVDSDAALVGRLLTACGMRYVEDFSPSGGRHLYVPLQDRLDAAEARELVEALALMAMSLDPSPHQNITDGCIRVPGTLHKSGGRQVLVTPLSEAYDVLRRRNPASALVELRAALAPELARKRALKAREAKTVAAQRLGGLPTLPVMGESEAPLRRVARTGLYDTARYKTASEARMAVLNHFSASGWSLQQVQGELTGQFPGLAALYGSAERQARLLPYEWAKAQAFTSAASSSQKPLPRKDGEKNALINNTSPTLTTGGARKLSSASVNHLVNDVENIVHGVLDHRLRTRGREGLSLRLLIRGLLGYMRAKETDILDVGCRTLAAALGKHHVTIARLLPILAAVSDGILTKVADARQKAADVYLIQLPAKYQQLARELTWRKGKIYAVRPVFRALGDPAALVYEAIERGRHSPTTAEIVRASGVSRNTCASALAEMEALGMIQRHEGTWRTTSANLRMLAARLGVLDDYLDQIRRNRHERAIWHAYLARFIETPIEEADLYEHEREEIWIPPDDNYTLWQAA
ncbi:ArsR/SmtB family transcription factor [Paenarthrobacter sp. NPDC089675]|uniref:ArsR/SmtB family transcription factor n=1 Tax=Paenarthrobacter sp. NPDC089675 TaxID=3364376 RepID=UPI003829CA96